MAALCSWRLCAVVLLGVWLVLLALVECWMLVRMLLASACHVCGASRRMQTILSLWQQNLTVLLAVSGFFPVNTVSLTTAPPPATT